MKKVTIAALAILLFCSVSAQKSFSELANMPDKKFEKQVFTYHSAAMVKSFANSARKYGLDLADPLVPKTDKVGILCFYTADLSEINAKALKHGGTVEDYLTTAGGKQVLRSFYQESLAGLREAFANQNMQLLTPEEYLTDGEKVAVYNSHEIAMGKAVSALLNATSRWADEEGIVAAEGYRLFPAPTQLRGGDAKVINSVAELANKLGLDALLTVQILTIKEKTEIGMKAIRMSLHAPNPIPDDPRVKYGMGKYVPGVLLEYAGTEFGEPIPFATLPKKANEITNVHTEAFDQVMTRYAGLLVKNLRSDYAGK